MKIIVAPATLALVLLGPAVARADAWAPSGDSQLREDLTVLADAGVLRTPLTTWPIPWADVGAQLATPPVAPSPIVASAWARVSRHYERAQRRTELALVASGALHPRRMRGFEQTPREDGAIEASIGGRGERWDARLSVQAVASPEDGQHARLDGSYVAGAFGHVIVSAGALDRWWGPGHDGSLILSSAARPMPALSIERARSTPFESRWLSWLGPWRAIATVARFEGDRNDAPHATLFGLRFVARPLAQLEIGLSRTAQICGEGRPCDVGTWWDMLVGHDNGATTPDEEPSNQLAGVDARWAFRSVPIALYGQAIGEDEAGGLPSRYVALLGAEIRGGESVHWRAYAEFAETTADFYGRTPLFGYAYEHFIYTDGYSYRNRPLGHAADRDARLASAGLLATTGAGTWSARMVAGRLNRGGAAAARPHAWSASPADYASVTVGWRGAVGTLEVGVQAGYERLAPDAGGGGGRSAPQASLEVRRGF